MSLRLGIIGLSEGNGHPYSWSAIFNGYDVEKMQTCPFPVIPDYLSKEKFPEAQIATAKVTHIWTQSLQVSRTVAEASLIPNVVENPADFIGNVDAVLLARDDAENHFDMAKPYLDARLPVYIDKPLAYSLAEAKKLFSLERYRGQLFTCSALQYARELHLTSEMRAKLGPIRKVSGQIKKDWAKYSIHMIEPVLRMIGPEVRLVAAKALKTGGDVRVDYKFENGVEAEVTTSMDREDFPARILVTGDRGEVELKFQNTFAAFKSALEMFVAGAKNRQAACSKDFVLRSIEMVEAGL